MKPLLAVAALVAGLVFAGCMGPTSGPDFVTPPQDEHGRYVIEMTGTNQFIPKFAEVPAGATVVWVNVAGAHNVEADDHSFSSGAPQAGAWEYEQVFTEVGEWSYHCHPHVNVGMTATLRVVADASVTGDEEPGTGDEDPGDEEPSGDA